MSPFLTAALALAPLASIQAPARASTPGARAHPEPRAMSAPCAGGCIARARPAPASGVSAAPSAGPGGFQLAVSYDPAFTAAEVAVLDRARQDWLALILDGAGIVATPYPVSFVEAPLPAGQVADTETTWDPSTGALVSSRITIDSDTAFFVDPTPWEDSEFTAGACSSGACGGFDLLTVARHGLGHALGWTGHFAPELNPWLVNLMPAGNGTTFDPTRWRVPLDPNRTSHVDPAVWPTDLMTPVLPPGVRRGISLYPDLTVIARGFNYVEVAMRYAADVPTPGGGSAFYPYWKVASQQAPAGVPILLSADDYPFEAGTVLDTPHVWTAAHGGSAVLR